ncbi:LamG-like jellyroll fold domain-containing protein [uncultured Aquimarina sp.]|uniref:LamG-like jellyroll fold domain-containing protein n=1 Tax=uncultured Aquimarina sp. TaxID=575652 RepID=UPI00262CC366|nr:LamG-like jellyroll fold domain-containing protein [uncultured Aquimarina sp.]
MYIIIQKIFLFIIIGSLFTSCATDNGFDTELTSSFSEERKSNITSIWKNVNRSFAKAPTGNEIGISCHNCYAPENSAMLSPTLNVIHAAQNAGADLIELDVYELRNTIYVNHIQQTTGTLTLENVLKDHKLRSGNQVLFIEIKGTNPLSIGQKLITLLDRYNYISKERPVVIRSFLDCNLEHIKNYLPSFSKRNYVYLSKLFGETNGYANELQWHNEIRSQMQKGRKMVEFNYKTSNLMSKIMYSKSLGLATNLYTLTNFAEVYVAGLRNELDAVTIEAGQRSKVGNIALSRQVVQEQSQLIYSNFALQTFSLNRYNIYDSTVLRSLNLNASNSPILENLSIGKDRYGKSLVFNASKNQFIKTWDRDNNFNGGFLITTIVNFDNLNLNPNETQAIIQKADAAGFALELHRSNSGVPVLRFGIHNNGSYHYSSLPTSLLDTNNSYVIIGAYDGNGGVHLWVDENHAQPSVSISGGITQNNSPVVIGADPQGSVNTRFYFSGKIQMINIMKWDNH